LKEHEAGVSVSDLCRKHGVSDAGIYKWKAKFGGMEISEAGRLRRLEGENSRRHITENVICHRTIAILFRIQRETMAHFARCGCRRLNALAHAGQQQTSE
jgi:transposase-like protein